MHTIIVTIPNAPLLIQRHFTFTELYAANEFEAWVKEQGLDYTRSDKNPHFLTHAIAAVEQELALAANHRVA